MGKEKVQIAALLPNVFEPLRANRFVCELKSTTCDFVIDTFLIKSLDVQSTDTGCDVNVSTYVLESTPIHELHHRAGEMFSMVVKSLTSTGDVVQELSYDGLKLVDVQTSWNYAAADALETLLSFRSI